MYQKMFNLHSDLLKAMSHPKRLEIIQLLRDGEMNVSEMVEMLGLPQANLSQHLMVLREAGVVVAKKNGKEVSYRMAHRNFVKASDLMREILVERYQGDELADDLVLKMKDLVPVVKDPVCGMRLSPKIAAYVVKEGGGEFYFCAEGCKKKFEENKKKFINLNEKKDE